MVNPKSVAKLGFVVLLGSALGVSHLQAGDKGFTKPYDREVVFSVTGLEKPISGVFKTIDCADFFNKDKKQGIRFRVEKDDWKFTIYRKSLPKPGREDLSLEGSSTIAFIQGRNLYLYDEEKKGGILHYAAHLKSVDFSLPLKEHQFGTKIEVRGTFHCDTPTKS